ncbi:hypothetical protein CTI14_67980, partial [Methylobacterium radiotolerans]
MNAVLGIEPGGFQATVQPGVPYPPFAAGSSLEGQIVPVHGGLSLDVTGMNAVLGIEPGGFQATVQPGVPYP